MDLDENTIRKGAPITFFNVIFLSFLFTIVNEIYRKIIIDRPVNRILNATEQITKGNFTVRIKPMHKKNKLMNLTK